MSFTLYEIENAPQPANNELAESQKAFGFVPNLHKVLAESPVALEVYKYLHEKFQATSFDPTELTVVWQTINYYHHCHYCLPGHTGIAHFMKVDPDVIEALNDGEPLKDEKLSALQATTRAIVDQRGQLTDEQTAAFKEAGYGEQQLLEILVGLAQKTISNFTNHFADTPIDKEFAHFANSNKF